MRHQRKISFMLLLVFIFSIGMSTAVEAGVERRKDRFIVNSPVAMPLKVYIDGVYEEDFDLREGENVLGIDLGKIENPERFWLELSDDFVGHIEVKGSQYKGKTFGLPTYYGGNIYVDFVEVGSQTEDRFIVNSPVAMPLKVYIDGVYEEDFDLREGENVLGIDLGKIENPERFWLELSDDFVGDIEVKGSQYKGKTFGLPIYYGGNIRVDFVELDKFIVNSPVAMPLKVYIDGVYEEDFNLKEGKNILDIDLESLGNAGMFWLELSDDFVGKVELEDSPYKGKTFGLPDYEGGDIELDFVELEEELEFKSKKAAIEDDFKLVLEYSKGITRMDYLKLNFGGQLEAIDQEGRKVNLYNYSLEDGRLVVNYDRDRLPERIHLKSEGIFTSIDGDKSPIEKNIRLVDNRPVIMGSGTEVEKISRDEIRVNISVSEDLDIPSLLSGLDVSVGGRSLKTNRKLQVRDGYISLGFDYRDGKLGEEVVLTFSDLETIGGSKLDSLRLEKALVLDSRLDSRIDKMDREMENYIFDLTSPVGPLGLTEEMKEKNFWPSPAFENALNGLRDSLAGMEELIQAMEKDLSEIRDISGEDYDKLVRTEEKKDYLSKSLFYSREKLIPRGDYFIEEADKTESIKRRMRDIAYKLHKHRVHSFLLEPEELDRLIGSMASEREEAGRIELDYMKKMALDDIEEMEAKLKVVKVACDFYLEEDLDLAYSQIDYVKGQLMRLPADIGNELYDFIEDKINLAIEYHTSEGSGEGEGVFKVEEVNLLDGNIVEIKLSNPINWYDQDFKEDNCMFVLKTSEKEGYDNFVSVEKTEIDLKGNTVRLIPRDGVVPSHYEVPRGVPIKDFRGMTPEEKGISQIRDLRTK